MQSPTELVTAYLRYLGALLPGGPWGSGVVEHAYLTPPSWAVGVGLVVLLALVALTLTNGGLDARLAWATLVAHALLSVGLLAVQRQGTLAASLDLIHRYGADAALVLTLVVAAAVRRTPAPSFAGCPGARACATPRPVRRELVVAVAAALALVASAAVSTPALAAPLLHDDDRAFVGRRTGRPARGPHRGHPRRRRRRPACSARGSGTRPASRPCWPGPPRTRSSTSRATG